jgi:hypothetical protein
MKSQLEKYHLAMAGEYFVAAQLQRLRVAASVTYGNAKKADLLVFSATEDRVVRIEVKCTEKLQWIIGNEIPAPSKRPWVLVGLPPIKVDAPKFYVLTQEELNKVLVAEYLPYWRAYEHRHGESYPEGSRKVIKVGVESVLSYENNWDSIIQQL